MRSTIRLIITLSVIFGMAFGLMQLMGCGGKAIPKALTPAEAIAAGKAPWDTLPDKANYVNCGEATTAMTAISTVWDLAPEAEIGGPNPSEVAPNRFMEFRTAPDGSGFALVQYRMTDAKKRVNELAVILNAAGEQLVLDYHIKRALDTGELTGQEEESMIFGLATGDFFCFYP